MSFVHDLLTYLLFFIFSAREAETIIGVELPHLSEVRTILLQRGGQASELEVLRQEDIMVIKSNKPVMIVYLTRSFVPKDTKGDTSMTIIPAVEQYVPFAQYRGVKTASSKRKLSHVAMVVCESEQRQNIAITSSSEEHSPVTEWQEIGETGFSYAIVHLHRLQTYTFQSATPSDTAANFGLWFIGYMAYEGYGHPAGFNFHIPEDKPPMMDSTKGPLAFIKSLQEDGRNFVDDVEPTEPPAYPSDASIPPKVEKIVAVTAAISVVAIVVVFKVIGCFYTLRESKV